MRRADAGVDAPVISAYLAWRTRRSVEDAIPGGFIRAIVAVVDRRFLTLVLLVPACASACSSAARPSTDAATSLRIVILSDLNSSYGSTTYEPEVTHAVATTVRELRPDLVLIAGDMIAGQRPTLTDENVRAMWTAFDTVVAAPLRAARIPHAFTLGNHDASAHTGHERDRWLAREYWRVRQPQLGIRVLEDGAFPFYYAFQHRGIFVLVFDATTGRLDTDSAQLSWLRRTLASEAARRADLRIALGHVPLYAVAQGRNQPGEVQAAPELIRAMLEAGNVRMHISGHHHAYYPARRGTLELLHAGALGQGPRPLIGHTAEPYKTFTVLDLLPDRDSIVDRTYRYRGAAVELVDVRALPPRIDGVNGWVVRRDAR